MSFGIVCLKCRRYCDLKNQPVSVNACECYDPAYSENAKTEITYVEAERLAKQWKP